MPRSILIDVLGIISLGGGLPSSEYFPFDHVEIKVPRAPHFSEKETRESGTLARIGKHDVAEGKDVLGMCYAAVKSKHY